MSGFFDLTNIPAPDLDKLLCSFFKDLRKKDGSDYEPDTVSSLQRSTERHITEQKLLFDILKDDAFSLWYKSSPLGKNEIGKSMSTAAKNAGLAAQKKKISNHSVRKTSIYRLLDAGVPENFVMQLSGLKNLQ
ncbi:unnamed protein product, partial [Porites evermanni]